MKTVVIVFLVASACIQCSTSSKQNIRKKRAWVVDSLSMEEEHSGPFPYKLGDLNIEKRVLEEYFIHGQGIDKDPKGILSVNTNGSVYALGKVDYEEYEKLTIKLTKENTNIAVDIVIQDVNDHAPVFNTEVYEITIDESTPQGEHLVTVLATDADQFGSANSLFTMKIVSVSPQSSNTEFFIDQTEGDMTGMISFKGCLDYEETQKYTILVEAKDHGEKVQLSSTSTVILNIIDKNNHLPEFTGTNAFSMETGWMLEAKKLSMCLSEKNTDITAIDPDLYSPSFHFELMGDVEGKWKLHSNYGTTVRLIKESAVQAGDHELSLKISDSRGQSSLQTLSVHVCDCDVSANCHVQKAPAIQMNVASIVAIVISILVLLGILLLACQIRCRAKKSARNSFFSEAYDQSLSSDIFEKSETDCMCFES